MNNNIVLSIIFLIIATATVGAAVYVNKEFDEQQIKEQELKEYKCVQNNVFVKEHTYWIPHRTFFSNQITCISDEDIKNILQKQK